MLHFHVKYRYWLLFDVLFRCDVFRCDVFDVLFDVMCSMWCVSMWCVSMWCVRCDVFRCDVFRCVSMCLCSTGACPCPIWACPAFLRRTTTTWPPSSSRTIWPARNEWRNWTWPWWTTTWWVLVLSITNKNIVPLGLDVFQNWKKTCFQSVHDCAFNFEKHVSSCFQLSMPFLYFQVYQHIWKKHSFNQCCCLFKTHTDYIQLHSRVFFFFSFFKGIGTDTVQAEIPLRWETRRVRDDIGLYYTLYMLVVLVM